MNMLGSKGKRIRLVTSLIASYCLLLSLSLFLSLSAKRGEVRREFQRRLDGLCHLARHKVGLAVFVVLRDRVTKGRDTQASLPVTDLAAEFRRHCCFIEALLAPGIAEDAFEVFSERRLENGLCFLIRLSVHVRGGVSSSSLSIFVHRI